MSHITPYMYPATLVSYDSTNRTAKVSIAGLTDGVADGITAMLAYPIGDDDLDTERELIAGADVWVFFEQGDTSMPVIAFYRRHGQGRAAVDVRRIRQENIELLARANVTITANDLIFIKANQVTIEGELLIKGNVTHKGNSNQTGNATIKGNQAINGSHTVNGESVSYGNQTINGTISATGDIKSASISLKSHKHGGVETGGGSTSTPQ